MTVGRLGGRKHRERPREMVLNSITVGVISILRDRMYSHNYQRHMTWTEDEEVQLTIYFFVLSIRKKG